MSRFGIFKQFFANFFVKMLLEYKTHSSLKV